MITNSTALRAALEQGRTVVRMADFEDPGHFRWVMSDCGEAVHAAAFDALLRRGQKGGGALKPIAFDLCGAPMQYGWSGEV